MLRRGFTLTEVVTVLAIVMILATLAFSLARPARHRALESASSNQMRQFGLCVLQYAADSDSTSTYPELHGMTYTNGSYEIVLPPYGLTSALMKSPAAPRELHALMASTYLLSIDANPSQPDGSLSDARRRMIEREKAMGARLEALIDSAPDEFFYYPSERHIDLALASPYMLWVAVDGSIQSDRMPPPRFLDLRRHFGLPAWS